jgi:sialate O-acetylesterase
MIVDATPPNNARRIKPLETSRWVCRPDILFALLAGFPASAFAAEAPRFAGVFSDHAVLQRGVPVAIWGTAGPSQPLTVSFDGRTFPVTTGTDGKWRVDLPAMRAGGPHSVSVEDGAGNKSILSDILLGDVFLCSGQSNMEFLVKYSTGAWGGAFMPANDNLRFINIAQDSEARPLSDLKTPAAWQVAGPTTTANTSAVCYYMASAIQAEQNVPVGMINSSWGGTLAQAWISSTGLRSLHAYDAGLDALANYARSPATAKAAWSKMVLESWRAGEPDAAVHEQWIGAGFEDSDWKSITPSVPWEGSGDPDLAAFDGIVWYRQTFTLTSAEAKSATAISLGPIDDFDITWINGKVVGVTNGWQLPREYSIAPRILKPGRNVVVVRAVDTGGGGGLWGRTEDRKLTFSDGSTRPLPTQWRYRIAGQPNPGTVLPNEPWNGLTNLYNGMIAPLTPYRIRAVAWYQGEANTYSADEYRKLLPLLMSDWRAAFRQPDLPFLIVQLANYGSVATTPGPSSWAALREAQRRAVNADPHAALTVSIDFGDRSDIHPAQKAIIGQRLARNARAVVYGENVTPGGPEATAVSRSGNDLIIRFKNTNGGLRTYSSNMAIAFEVCSSDDACAYVNAIPNGDIVTLKGANTASAASVRYAWADSPYVNLYSADDLPAVPFQLDIPK